MRVEMDRLRMPSLKDLMVTVGLLLVVGIAMLGVPSLTGLSQADQDNAGASPQPQLLGQWAKGPAYTVLMDREEENLAYLGAGETRVSMGMEFVTYKELVVLDLTDPTNLFEVTRYAAPSAITDLFVTEVEHGYRIYLLSQGLLILGLLPASDSSDIPPGT